MDIKKHIDKATDKISELQTKHQESQINSLNRQAKRMESEVSSMQRLADAQKARNEAKEKLNKACEPIVAARREKIEQYQGILQSVSKIIWSVSKVIFGVVASGFKMMYKYANKDTGAQHEPQKKVT